MINKAQTVSAAMIAAREATRRILLQAGFFSLFVNLLMLTGPIYMLQIYDRVLSSSSVETLVVLTILTFVMFAAMGALDFARGGLLSRAGVEFENKLKGVTFDYAMDAAHSGAPLLERPLRDLRQIRQFIASPALTAFFDAPMTPLFLLMVYLMHWVLGLVATAGLIILLVLAMINERWSRKSNVSAQQFSVEADTMASAALRNASAADAMGMRAGLKGRWLQKSGIASDYAVSAGDKIGGVTATSKAVRLFLQSAILGTGAYLAIYQEVTPGVMIAASIITGRALAPIEMVTSQWRNFAMSWLAYKRLNEFVEAGTERIERTALPAPVGEVELDRLYVQPPSSKKPIVKNVSFKLAPGEALGVIGPSAAGKSTLVRALVGVERVVAGEIRLDGANIDHWDRDALGPYIGYLPQEVELFAGSAAQNIARFKDDADPEKIIAAAEAAGAHQMILSLSDGYDTDIGDHGRRLSAGQKQRLGLARALYGDPIFVVLDEPNANLDAEGDAALAKAVQRLKARGATTIIVAHRPSTIAYVDKLLMLSDGETRAFGPRDEVLKKIAPGLVASFDANAKQRQGGTGNAG
ncbi:MAG: type I secretion system permease/ATPase [Alphaproteobacteria bacterium]|nr:type I secretion system permease/ATPase [Alphaproteobacteria bacterium]